MAFRPFVLPVLVAVLMGSAAPMMISRTASAAEPAQPRLTAQAEPTQDQLAEALMVLEQGMQQLGSGELESAVQSLDQAVGLSREIGDRQLEAIALIARGKALVDMGNAESGRVSVEEGLAIAQELGDPQMEQLAEGILSEIQN